MIGKEKLFKKLESIIDRSPAEQAEVVFIGREEGLTRYANSYIHQNVFEENRKLLFRSVIGKRVGVASTNSLNVDDLRTALENSLEIAKQQPENPHFPGLPGSAKYKDLNTFDEGTARFGPRERAKAVKKVIKEASRKKFTVAGACAGSVGEIAVLNSLGVRAYQPFTSASVNMIVMSNTSSGYASDVSRSVGDLDFTALAKTAVEKCDLSQNPEQIEPGEYEVILEPAAVSEILEWLNYIGFNSKAFEQKMSFLAGRTGRKVTSEKITLYDNALDDGSLAFPFDFEGVPKQRVSFISKGVAKGCVYDLLSAKKARKKSTGHALTADESSEGALS
jgi:predicted Zn-dependent protease